VVQKLATTGQAADAFQGNTVHSFFGLNGELKVNLHYNDLKWNRLRETNIFIIDEISMLTDEILIAMNNILNVIGYFKRCVIRKKKYNTCRRFITITCSIYES
jgi:hypothetical protein